MNFTLSSRLLFSKSCFHFVKRIAKSPIKSWDLSSTTSQQTHYRLHHPWTCIDSKSGASESVWAHSRQIFSTLCHSGSGTRRKWGCQTVQVALYGAPTHSRTYYMLINWTIDAPPRSAVMSEWNRISLVSPIQEYHTLNLLLLVQFRDPSSLIWCCGFCFNTL